MIDLKELYRCVYGVSSFTRDKFMQRLGEERLRLLRLLNAVPLEIFEEEMNKLQRLSARLDALESQQGLKKISANSDTK